MLAVIIFASLAGLLSVVLALANGLGFGLTLVIYLTVSGLGIVVLPVLLHLWTRTSRRP